MGQFKPMVKMETTEPSVELKLKKGGHVNMKKGGKAEAGHKKMAGGGSAMESLMGTPALVGRPAVNAPVRAPGKPSMASRRKSMMAKKPMAPPAPAMGMPPMKKGGKAEGGESKKTHMAEMSKMKGLEKELKSHESKPASKGHKGLKTGGVANGQGGYAKGGGVAGNGIINTEKQGGVYNKTKMDTAKPNHSPAKTGDVKNGNGGGFKTGGVTKSNAGGYKMGGVPKKAYATGGTVNSGRAVAMPQGKKPASPSVRINQLAGTYKDGGKAAPGNRKLQGIFDSENSTAMREAKAQSNMKYMAGGGSVAESSGRGAISDRERKMMETDMSKGAYDAHYANEKAENESDRKMMKDALMYLPRQAKKAFNSLTGQGAVTTTEREISKTVSPAGKKRGGRAC